jgi:RecB family exonuclease
VGATVERNRLLQELAAFCDAHPIDEKILLVPSFPVGTQILDALARSGCAHLNFRPETVRSLALELVGPELAKEGIRLASRAQALALVEEASDDAFASGSYFHDLRARPGLNRALLATLSELERAGAPVDRLPPEAFEDPRKAEELARVRSALRASLQRNAFATPDDVLARAVSHARNGRHPFGSALLLRPEDLELSPAEGELVTHLAGGRAIRLAVDPPDFSFASRAKILAATGEENEVRAALRRILSTGIPFDQVEITATDAATYGPLLFELFEEHGVPATFQDGLPASSARPGRAALAFLEWISDGFPARVLATALSDGLIEVSSVRPAGSGAGSGRLAGLLLRARVFRGRGRYLRRLAALRSRGERGPDEGNDRRDEAASVLFELAKKLLDLVPEDVETLSLPALARVTRNFLGTFARVSAARDGVVREALLGLCTELAALPERPLAAGEAAARLAEAVRELAVGGTTASPGRLHVAPIVSAGFTGRPHSWVLGLDEARFPGAPRQDPVLLDHERARLNEILPGPKLSRPGVDAAVRTQHALKAALARTRGEVVLCFSERDLLEDADRFPSAFLLDVFRAKTGQRDADYRTLRDSVGTAEGFVPDASAALDDGAWWLATMRGEKRRDAHLPDVERVYPWLAEAGRAEEARAGTKFTEWDGRVAVPSGELDPRVAGPIVSASRLERLAACPRAYFFGDVLRLSVPEEERPAGVWLQPYEFGNLLHEVFHDFLAGLSARAERPTSSALPELAAVAERHLARWRDRVPPPTEASFGSQREELLAACAILLTGEERDGEGARPRFFEVPFGMPGEDPGAAGSDEPVEVDVGSGRFRLRGRIDRIDEKTSGRWSIWDYKSGSQRRFRDETSLDRGRRLQHVLYARAAEDLLRARGDDVRAVESGYIFPTRRGSGWRFVPPALSRARVDGVLNDLLDLLATGTFVHSPDEDDCRYCDFREICGDVREISRRAAEKLADESNESLQAFRALRESHD